jgi:hypothetical protein
MNNRIACLLGGLLLLSFRLVAQQGPMLADQYPADGFPLVHLHQAAPFYTDAQDAEVVRVATAALAQDITAITGATPAVRAVTEPLAEYAILIGTVGQSALLDQLAAAGTVPWATLRGQWETFSISVVDRPFGRAGRVLVVAGSDRRGTAYGVFELSRRLGVSPWYWWADVPPQPRPSLYLTAGTYRAEPPTVKYRGIFLNDEDWGLQPWAAQKMDPAIKDIGPNTYAHIFELLLRLKANLIWPAMHPSTRAFFQYPGNPEMADRYAILVGTSHAEPMLRNNVDEWHEATMGPFDYFQNQPAVYRYWAARAQQAGHLEAMYSLGMRGVHDSGMVGAKTPKEAAQMLSRVLADQRDILRRYVAPDVTTVPQVFTAYKEVLDVYDEGLKLPDDVLLAWPDDNYGYISRLSNAAEQGRPGGSGVYYHASYWGRPHDYLWLSSTHPGLIREEMLKAYAFKTDKLWVLNVGDIKPLEYNMQLFLDMAYAARSFEQPAAVPAHLEQWVAEIFGAAEAPAIRAALWEYYELAFERRPEFMGWSQTEPTTPTRRTAYNHFAYGDEARRRLDRYAALVRQVRQLRARLSPARADAFYELVYYPIMGAALLNQKFLYQDKSYWYARQNRASAADYARWARLAYDTIALETKHYNQQLAGGKWQGMMSMQPRNLPVFQAPAAFTFALDTTQRWGVSPECAPPADSARRADGPVALPVFYPWGPETHFIDVFLSRQQSVAWQAKTSAKWLVLSAKSGRLTAAVGQNEQRLQVGIAWRKVPKGAVATGTITLTGAGKTFVVTVRADPGPAELQAYAGFVETNGYLSLHADHYTRKTDVPARQWALVPAIGRAGQAVQALPLQPALAAAEATQATAAAVEYDFYSRTEAAPILTVATLPTHEATRGSSLRYGVAFDDGPMQVLDPRTVGRSEEWKQNVLRNSARRQLQGPVLYPGRHTLKVYLLDPGVVLDCFTLDFGGLQPAYGRIAETHKTAGRGK